MKQTKVQIGPWALTMTFHAVRAITKSHNIYLRSISILSPHLCPNILKDFRNYKTIGMKGENSVPNNLYTNVSILVSVLMFC
jgi:hypothetical protein